ncbi:MAG: N-acetylglucosamine-6-phosphate deacetylase [Microthrixaceae bacterium]
MLGGRDDLPVDGRLGVAAAVVDGAVLPGDVEVRSGVVHAVGCAPAGRGLALPGLVDLQVNGFVGVDLRTADVEEVHRVSLALAEHGCTSFRPTLCSTDLAGYRAALGRLDLARDAGVPGARLLPAHLEGPFLSPTWAGAHDPATLVDVDVGTADGLLRAGSVGMITMAPELPGADELIRELVRRGVVVSVGHTDADAGTVRRAIDRGATHLTHCWNAHRRFDHRDPGPAGVALSDPRLTVGLIADGVHVASEVVLATIAAAAGRVAVTTDAVAPAGLPGTAVDGARNDEGRLAGGLRSPLELLRSLRSSGLDWPAVVSACSTAAGRTAGGGTGLRPGAVADVVVLDERLELVRTLVGGVEVARPG